MIRIKMIACLLAFLGAASSLDSAEDPILPKLRAEWIAKGDEIELGSYCELYGRITTAQSVASLLLEDATPVARKGLALCFVVKTTLSERNPVDLADSISRIILSDKVIDWRTIHPLSLQFLTSLSPKMVNEQARLSIINRFVQTSTNPNLIKAVGWLRAEEAKERVSQMFLVRLDLLSKTTGSNLKNDPLLYSSMLALARYGDITALNLWRKQAELSIRSIRDSNSLLSNELTRISSDMAYIRSRSIFMYGIELLEKEGVEYPDQILRNIAWVVPELRSSLLLADKKPSKEDYAAITKWITAKDRIIFE